MSLLDSIRSDVARITGNAAEYGVSITFTAPDASTVTIIGTATKHHLGLDRNGAPANVKTASITVAESALVDAGYIVRNVAKEVALKNHKVSWVDKQLNLPLTYMIREIFPDETLGLIVCILGDFK